MYVCVCLQQTRCNVLDLWQEDEYHGVVLTAAAATAAAAADVALEQFKYTQSNCEEQQCERVWLNIQSSEWMQFSQLANIKTYRR